MSSVMETNIINNCFSILITPFISSQSSFLLPSSPSPSVFLPSLHTLPTFLPLHFIAFAHFPFSPSLFSPWCLNDFSLANQKSAHWATFTDITTWTETVSIPHWYSTVLAGAGVELVLTLRKRQDTEWTSPQSITELTQMDRAPTANLELQMNLTGMQRELSTQGAPHMNLQAPVSTSAALNEIFRIHFSVNACDFCLSFTKRHLHLHRFALMSLWALLSYLFLVLWLIYCSSTVHKTSRHVHTHKHTPYTSTTVKKAEWGKKIEMWLRPWVCN